MKIGKVVLTASIALFAMVVLNGCVTRVNPETGEKSWKIAPGAAIKDAIETVKEMPDETKASIFEGLGWVLGFLGAGAAATPVCTGIAGYYRNRKKNAAPVVTETKPQVVEQKDSDKVA